MWHLWLICSSNFCIFSHLCLRCVSVWDWACQWSHWFWVRRLWLSLYLGFWLWLLAERVVLPRLMAMWDKFCTTSPPLNPFNTQLWTVHVFSQHFRLEKKLLSAEFQTLTRQGLDHSPYTAPLSYFPPLLTFYAIHPTLLSWAYWSIPGVVMVVCIDVSECVSACVLKYVCSSTVDGWSNETLE